MKPEATVFIVDDSVKVCDSMRELFESAGLAVEAYNTSEEFLAVYDPQRAGCLVLDVRLRQGKNGLDLQDELVRRQSTLPVIVLTGHGNVPMSVRALKAGAIDFLQKPAPPKILLARVEAALEGDRLARAEAERYAAVRGHLARLTPRESEVLEMLLKGKTSKDIANALDLSVRTVEGHRRMVFMKMDVTSASELVGVVLEARKGLPGA